MLIRSTEVIRAATDCRVGSQDRRDRLDRRIAYPRNDSTTYTFSCMWMWPRRKRSYGCSPEMCTKHWGQTSVPTPVWRGDLEPWLFKQYMHTYSTYIDSVYQSSNTVNKYLPQLGNLFAIGVGLVTHPKKYLLWWYKSARILPAWPSLLMSSQLGEPDVADVAIFDWYVFWDVNSMEVLRFVDAFYAADICKMYNIYIYINIYIYMYTWIRITSHNYTHYFKWRVPSQPQTKHFGYHGVQKLLNNYSNIEVLQ